MFSTLIKGFFVILFLASAAHAETVLPVIPPQAVASETPLFFQPVVIPAESVAREVVAPAVTEAAAPVLQKPAPVMAVKVASPVIVVEAPARLTFERMRREDSRYPEMGTVGRFVELSTECPPLFE